MKKREDKKHKDNFYHKNISVGRITKKLYQPTETTMVIKENIKWMTKTQKQRRKGKSTNNSSRNIDLSIYLINVMQIDRKHHNSKGFLLVEEDKKMLTYGYGYKMYKLTDK